MCIIKVHYFSLLPNIKFISIILIIIYITYGNYDEYTKIKVYRGNSWILKYYI